MKSHPNSSAATPSSPHPYLTAARERVIIMDGAFGTYVQGQALTAEDFGGEALEGCNEYLCITRPDVISGMHNSFLELGVDAIETATFGAFSVPLGEYGLESQVEEINLAAARLARQAADSFSTPEKPRWVAGSIGPGTKFASLGQITYRQLREAFSQQSQALLKGGVDLLLIETVYDLLGAKAAIAGGRDAMEATGKQVPIQVQITIEQNGRMLTGTETPAAYYALAPLGIDVIGLNCATGPAEMSEHLRALSELSDIPISCLPNAGLPHVEGSRTVYDLTPTELADYLSQFVKEFGISVVGGCCGTTPEHLNQVVKACADLTPAPRQPQPQPSITSLFSAVPLQQDTAFTMISERSNANGSRKFRDLMLEGNWEACTQTARQQVAEGAHAVDLCVDYVGRDGKADMNELASRFATNVAVPLVLDSTEPDVLQAGLEHIGGRSVLNSANLEDGEGEGTRVDKVLRLAKEHGAAVICLLIDEEGQARDLDWKMRIARRLHKIATEEYGLQASDLIFDPLTFPLSTGEEGLRDDAVATIEAIRSIKSELPGVFCVLGVSNVSFGLNSAARQALNSVFLQECLEVGLDAAIVHAGGILPMHKIKEEAAQTCRDLIWNKREDGDPLTKLLEIYSDATSVTTTAETRKDWPVEDRLKQRIVDGDSTDMEADLQEALDQGIEALDVINTILLEGMRKVGELFASGQMQLPFVLRSAETMKASVSWLEPHLEKVDSAAGGQAGGATSKGRIVLATVKGDVHDIGKNLVDIILTNNGYEVHNLGIKVSISEMIGKCLEVDADALGMSGLLVKSTLIMRDNLEELNSRELERLPVMLGGAALTQKYVESDLREIYRGRLFYCKDAFAGLGVMDKLMEINSGALVDDNYGKEAPTVTRIDLDEGSIQKVAASKDIPAPPQPHSTAPRSPVPRSPEPRSPELRSPEVAADNTIFEPPFLGSRVIKGVTADEIAKYLNETALFRNQWQLRPEKGEKDPQFRERVRPLLHEKLTDAKQQGYLVPGVVYGYFCANSQNNDLIIWSDATRTEELTRFTFPRQSKSPYLCIADFFRPVGSELDYVAFHIATMGAKATEVAQNLFEADQYQQYLYVHGLGVEMAEALAEYWHLRVRQEWGFGEEDSDTLSGLFKQQHRGGRYSWGYPACPDLMDNQKVAKLLGADRLGIQVSEETSWQYHPEQTTSAIICHHPQAKYFVVK